MEEEKSKWEEQIRSKIYDLESDTNPDDWDLIAAKLSEGKVVPLSPYRRYGYIAAAVVSTLLIISGLYFYPQGGKRTDDIAKIEKTVDHLNEDKADYSTEHIENTVVSVEKPIKTVEKATGSVENPEKTVDETVELAVNQEEMLEKGVGSVENPEKTVEKGAKAVEKKGVSVEKSVPHVDKAVPHVDKSVEKWLATSEKEVQPVENKPAIELLPEPAIQVLEQAMLSGFEKINPAAIDLDAQLVAEVPQASRRRRWGFGMGGGGYTVNTTSGGAGMQPYSAVLPDDTYQVSEDIVFLRNTVSSESLSNQSEDRDANAEARSMGKIKYKTPLSAGLGVSYYINDRWALQSGVVYTLLRSKGSYYDQSASYAEWKQNLHYIGVPLSASYKIAEWNRLQLYATAGGMCEFNVSGKLKETIHHENLQVRENESLRMKTPMWSINARGGVVYPLWRFIQVYAEAGVSYYFDNHSEIETIRSDKPFNVSLQAGFRLGF